MRCVYCGHLQSRVVDSRLSDDGTCIRRRRECEACSRRFTTYEKVEMIPVMVVKRDGTREAFDPAKIRPGVMKACEKRKVSQEQIDHLLNAVETKILARGETEVSSMVIGEEVMSELKRIDEVAYVRFASVYRQFADIRTFMEELKSMLTETDKGTPDAIEQSVNTNTQEMRTETWPMN